MREIPFCPITGLPAKRKIQPLSKALMIGLWRWIAGVDVARLIGPARQLGLWESPCGLAFFQPMLAGDEAFYADLYRNMRLHEAFLDDAYADRAEFVAASAFVRAGDRVLDVGCGRGPFRRHVPDADYVGIDPYLAEADFAPGMLRATPDDHARSHPEVYDAVCAFQVIEHVADPRRFAETLVSMVKPGGLLILGAPLWPSALNRTPNMVINAIPHHLSWWTVGALEALAGEFGLDVLSARELPAHRQLILVHWLAWCSPVTARGPYFLNAISWHLSLMVAYGLAWLAAKTGRLPPDAQAADVFLAARKPLAAGAQ